VIDWASRPLPHSRPSDVAANRDARITGRQLLALLYSGTWRIVLGLPIAAIGVALAWAAPSSVGDAGSSGAFGAIVFLLMGLGLLGLGAYVSWRGFSFLGDAVTRNVSYVTGRIDGETRRYRGSTTRYMVIGPSKTRISRKTYDALAMGRACHAYYASGSFHLLSLEPETEAEPHPALRFGGDAAHAWDRVRWPWLVGAVAAFGLAAGVNGVIMAHSMQTSTVSGSISSYRETHGRSASIYLSIEGDQTEYYLNQLDGIPQLYSDTGQHVDLYINTDTVDKVVALRLGQTLYSADFYRHPEHQYWAMAGSGIAIFLLSGLTLAVMVWWKYWSRRHHLGAYDNAGQASDQATSV
jgi:hypothetical protein